MLLSSFVIKMIYKMFSIQYPCLIIFVVIILIKKISSANATNCNDAIENNFPKITKEVSEVTNYVQKMRRNNKSDDACIWQLLIKIYNGISNIPEELFSVLNWVIPTIKEADYENITFTDIDMIQNFGLDYNLTDEQISAIAERVRKDYASKEPEDYTVYDLKALRNILCGFNTSEIERIHPSAYKEASQDIGQLKCKSDVMKSFAALAIQKEAFGAAENWNEDIVKTVGNVAKYLSRNKLDDIQTKKP